MNVREIALRLLLEYEASGKYVNLSLSSHIADGLSKEDRRLLTSLLYSTVEHKITYDYYIASFTGAPADKLSEHTRNVLRLGICQIVDMTRIPKYAAVNETVKLAKNPGERSLVNGVLRRVSSTDTLPLPPREKNLFRHLSVKYSIPLPTVKHLAAMIPSEELEPLLVSFNKKGGITLTVNTLKTDVDSFVSRLNDEGYCATRGRFSPISVAISESVSPTELPVFLEGHFFVQDEASALAAAVLSPTVGERVIDVCSAPGGKSFAMAILANDGATVNSFDVHESKMSLISSGAERLGLKSVKAAVRDATLLCEEDVESYDAVLCDVPCSGLGVLAKKPDLRYKDVASLDSLPPLQLDILSTSSKYLKPGGRLVYSTCTLNRGENEEVVSEFLSSHKDFYAEDFEFSGLSSHSGCLTLYPHIHNTDGFFIAKLRKK